MDRSCSRTVAGSEGSISAEGRMQAVARWIAEGASLRSGRRDTLHIFTRLCRTVSYYEMASIRGQLLHSTFDHTGPTNGCQRNCSNLSAGIPGLPVFRAQAFYTRIVPLMNLTQLSAVAAAVAVAVLQHSAVGLVGLNTVTHLHLISC